MAKKVEVFQSEYEFLTQFHREATLELTKLRAEWDELKKENELLLAALAKADFKLECQNCEHNGQQIDTLCEQADCMCDRCDSAFPCKDCVGGSKWEWDKNKKEI